MKKEKRNKQKTRNSGGEEMERETEDRILILNYNG